MCGCWLYIGRRFAKYLMIMCQVNCKFLDQYFSFNQSFDILQFDRRYDIAKEMNAHGIDDDLSYVSTNLV